EILANNAFVYDLGDIFCVWQNETAEDLTEITLDFFVGDNGVYHRSSERFFERGYAPEELRVLLNKAGLEIIETYDGYTDNPPGPESERVVYVASLVPAS
ncbi:MAG: class I SAM-dependent methyltransferase, partial [Oscillospiraceae bacterium]|nr:class I SAM-dependent methyltransferase [Oscillospiraceae bacterium]